jgi:hypothetical protein
MQLNAELAESARFSTDYPYTKTKLPLWRMIDR